MHDFAFPAEQNDLPAAADPDRVAHGFEHWHAAAAETGDQDLEAFAEASAREPASRRLLEALFGNSPFLTHCVVQDPAFARRLLTRGPDAAYAHAMAALDDDGSGGEAALARALRIARRRVALTVAAADITAVWPLERVTGALSDFADAALARAAGHLLRDAAAQGVLSLPDPTDPERGSGLVVLGLGKLGGRELNYSSDIDLIVLFDRERIQTDQSDRLQNNMIRLTRALVRLMEERTADGYVFRTDLRLRPDPGSTPLALSVAAAETYYESLGQNWERSAMIKARPVAGDRQAAEDFLNQLGPFVWRKHLDFAAIRDIHSIKRQINAHRGGGTIALGGHNIKLGRGGIREIEFFVQTQQLIWGGREPSLRSPITVEALHALAEADKITRRTADDLAAAYRYLRRVEHRLQMISDEQTHTLPEDPAGLRHLALFLGARDADAFADELLATLRSVEGHYAELFEDQPALSVDGETSGNLVFTGGDADPETIRTLRTLGFADPAYVDSTVRGWHHGRYRAMRSARARELLTEIMPSLLAALAGAEHPDATFRRFDVFLSRLPAGVQLFSMFHANPHLLALVAEIMGGAPRLADHLSRHPAILETVLAGDFFDPPPPCPDLITELDRALQRAADMEDIHDISRRWANDRKFQVGVQALRHAVEPEAAAAAHSNIAEATLTCLLPRIEADFARRHGRVPGCGMAVVAMGKLGGREMTATSDLDLIFVYDTPEGTVQSDGDKPLPASQYFARLSQRLINALTAQTAQGRLYDVDMRLRPSGKAGPIASSFAAFEQYQRHEAWTWEQMALTRARVIAGPPDLCQRVAALIRDVLTAPRDVNGLLADVAEMRARMDDEHHTGFVWHVKHVRGGLVDIEFIAQFLQLAHAHTRPDILHQNTRHALVQLRDGGFLPSDVATQLIDALAFWQAMQAMLRLTIEGRFTEDREGEMPVALRQALAKLGGASDYAELKAKAKTTAGQVRAHFTDLIETPAAGIGGSGRETDTAGGP